MGWLSQKVNSWASNSQRKELEWLVEVLRGMDGAELGHLVAIATHMRHTLESDGHDVMEPVVYTARNIGFPLFLVRKVQEAKKQGREQDAAALMIWAHTARAGVRLELRPLAREMWRQLERGFPHVRDGAEGFERLAGVSLNIRSAEQFPAGFTPDPR